MQKNKRRFIVIIVVLFLLVGGFFATVKFLKKDYSYILKIPDNLPKTTEDVNLTDERRQELENRIKELEQKITEDPEKLDNYWDLAIQKKSLGDLYGAAEVYISAIQINPDYYLGYTNLGNMYKLMGDPYRAERAYWEALVRAKTRDFVYSDLAELYEYYLHSKEKAIDILMQGIEALPYNNLELVKQLAALYERDGNLEKSLEYWKFAKDVALKDYPEIDAKIVELEDKLKQKK